MSDHSAPTPAPAAPEPDQAPYDDVLRPHVYDDNIREYDKRLPNWWLFTLYAAIAFSICYWVVVHIWQLTKEPGLALVDTMKENQLAAAKQSGVMTNEVIWQMSRDQAVVRAGETTFLTTCASCHKPDLTGLIGPNLRDDKRLWYHGRSPLQIVDTVTNGVLAKGMPTWGPILGKSKITEVVAFILSHHQSMANGSEPLNPQPFVPQIGVPGAAPAPASTQTAPTAPTVASLPAASSGAGDAQ
jgi:cytochrome c oxidase cbb3-type subunit 3